MSTIKFTSIALLSLLTLNTSAQMLDDAPPSKLPSVALGAGILYFNGDIGKGAGITPYGSIRPAFSLVVEERPLPYLGVSLQGTYGKLSASERSLDTTRNLNFQSTIISADLLVSLHLQGLVIKNDVPIDPFFYAGASFLSFSPYTDVKDASGNRYYYWTDGTVRNQAENSSDIITAKVVARDYKYETPLDSGKYSKTTFSLPVGLGIKLRVTDNVALNIQTTYYFTFSPNIDNYKISGKNNKYIYSFFTIEYKFNKKKADGSDARYQGVDFGALIKDNTPKEKVPEVKEVVMSDSAIAAQHAKDTMAVDRSGAFNENPNTEALTSQDKAISNKSNTGHQVPARYQPADKNGDGVISSQEITQSIDEFFDGSSKMTIQDINGLIDYFFDQ